MANVKITKYGVLTLRKWIEQDNGNAALEWCLRNSAVCLTAYVVGTKVKLDNGRLDESKIVRASFLPLDFYALLEKFEAFVKNDTARKESIDHYDHKFEKGYKTNEIILVSTLSIGRHDNNVIYLSLTAKDKPIVTFDILPDRRYIKYLDSNGNEIQDISKLSKLYATGYLKLLRKLFEQDISSAVRDVKLYKTTTVIHDSPPTDKAVTVDETVV